MAEHTIPQWLVWAREIQAIGQTGLTYSTDVFDRERYQRLLHLASDIVAQQANLEQTLVVENFQIQPGYATPKVDVRGAIVQNDKILLVQERTDERWCLPGGWADVGDLPSEMVAREVWEESGFRVRPHKLVGVYDANRNGAPLEFYHAYKIVFLCDIIGGEARFGSETLAVDFFRFDALPPLSLRRTTTRHLHDIQAHLHDPQHPTVFD
jgi:ADP-ribose pyrophosphatase YjhB (NUDIX family)